jgi:hypothetical protein
MNHLNEHPLLITHPNDLGTAIGLLVTLRGVVSESKLPTLLGVDVTSDEPDLRGKPAEATGLLEMSVVTQEELDREQLRRGTLPTRGPGSYYRLVDPNSGQTVPVRGLN